MKIFLPISLFYTKQNCDLYGDIILKHDKRNSTFYIIDPIHIKSGKGDTNELRFIGQILDSKIKKHNGILCFRYEEKKPNIYLDTEELEISHVNIFLYDPAQLLRIVQEDKSPKDDINTLRKLLLDRQTKETKLIPRKYSIGCIICKLLNLPLQLMTHLFVLFMESKIVIAFPYFNYTSFYEHYKEWHKYYSAGKRNWNITLDKILGILVMLLLLLYVQDAAEYVIEASYLVIDNVRILLKSLKGSPIGLKLNVHLNNFFLDVFNYHIDLWSTFLNIIEPSVRQLFIPITLLGSMGISCQLALLADLLSIIGLHAHCFYIYAAVLYKVEIRGLSVLFKVVRGKRFNTLKNRVESHNYVNSQLYLATIFFTTLLFLFPTILVYYVVFTTLRLCNYMTIWLLKTIRRQILEFPLQNLYEWCRGNYKNRGSIQIDYVKEFNPSACIEGVSKTRMSIFKINVQSSSLGYVFSSKSGVLQELTTNEDTSFGSIFTRILEGKF